MKSTLSKLLLLPILFLVAVPSSAKAQMFSVECGEVDDQAKAVNYSLYYESFKNEAYADAMPYLRWVISCAPLYPSNRDTNFRRLMQAYENLAKSATDPATKKAYLDSVLVTYDAMLPVLQEANIPVNMALAKIEKGRFLQSNAEALPERQGEVAQLYREAYDMQPDSTDTYTVQFLLADLLQKGDKATALEFSNEILDRFKSDTTLVNYTLRYIEVLFPTKEEKYEFYKAQLAANPEDEKALDIVIDLAQELRDTDMMEQLEPRILAMEPSVRTLRLIAAQRAARGDEAGAIELYEQAIELATEPSEKRDLYYNIGAYQHRAGNTSAARSAYRQALDIDPNYGRAILGLGDLIAACGSGSFEGRAVYWLATDYYARARDRDSSIASEANERIGRMRASYPSREDLFFRSISPGQSYTVTACGLNERTTVK